MDDVLRIRSDPGAFHPRWRERGALAVLEDLLTCSVIESVPRQKDPAVKIRILGPLSFSTSDNGRGMNFADEPGESVSHVEHVLTRVYPIPVPDPALAEAMVEWTWGDRGSIGPVLANALSSRFRIESERAEGRWGQDYTRGRPCGPAEPMPRSCPGTKNLVKLEADLMKGVPQLTENEVGKSLARLEALVPDLVVTLEVGAPS